MPRIASHHPQFRIRPLCAALLFAFTAQNAQANPVGGAVISGQASFSASGNTLTITNTPGTIINWQGFSIGANEITRFAQQSAASTVLNRVVTSNPSSILGTLQSNGRVFLINPNGIVFGQGATVDVAGMVASTLNLSDADFLAGRYNFTQVPGAQNISNAGSITAESGGEIYLIAPNVENSGVITAPNGEILLAAGHSVELVDTANPNLRVNITAPAGNATNVGQLVASAGSLGLFGTVVRNSGTVSADSATMQGGKIVFRASQRAEISGTVSANGSAGGSIQALGNQVGIMDGATISANGTQQGGTILIGGSYQGKSPGVPNAQVTYIAPTAAISADATLNGHGGWVIVWADDTTRAYGNLTAKGGMNGGNGGFVETSGKHYLDVAGIHVNTSAPNGVTGNWLLDPTDITIIHGTATGGATFPGAIFDNGGGLTATLNDFDINTALLTTNVTINTASAATGPAGNITFDASVGAGGNIVISNGSAIARTLTLNAENDIVFSGGSTTFQSPPSTSSLDILLRSDSDTAGGGDILMTPASSITSNGVTVSLNSGGAGGNITLSAGSAINAGTGTVNMSATGGSLAIGGSISANIFTLLGGTWSQISATLPGFTVNNFQIAGGTFIRALGGNGSSGAPYQLTDIYGVQGMGSAGMLGNAYVLANNINAAGTANWNAGGGFMPVGLGVNSPFTGRFDGQNHTISNLAINRTSSDVGLFGYTDVTATISNIGLAGGSVGGGWIVGGLVGWNGGTITGSYFTGSVNSIFCDCLSTDMGGLVGNNSGSISNSYASASVIAPGHANVGGLVGNNNTGGTISNSYSSGSTVSGYSSAGGLVGDNNGTISNSYSSGGSVSGVFDLGGLVGANWDTINSSYSTSAVAAGGGGLIGWHEGVAVNNSFWDTQTSGRVTSGGPEAGLTSAQMMAMASFTGWNIANTAGAGMLWRIYEGHTTPLLSSFLTPLAVSGTDSAKIYTPPTITPSLWHPNTNVVAGNVLGIGGGLYSVQLGYDLSDNITPPSLPAQSTILSFLPDLVNTMLIPGNGASGASQSTIAGALQDMIGNNGQEPEPEPLPVCPL